MKHLVVKRGTMESHVTKYCITDQTLDCKTKCHVTKWRFEHYFE